MSAASIAKKMLDLGACKEGLDWIVAGNHGDFRTGWKVCPPEFMCWTLARLLGLSGVRAAVVCSKALVQRANDPPLKEIIAVSEQVIDGKSTEMVKLQELAFDAMEVGLGGKKPNASTYLSASYAAYAVHIMVLSVADTDPALKLKHHLKASQHAFHAGSYARHGLPQKNLGSLVRTTIPDDTVYRAWIAAGGR